MPNTRTHLLEFTILFFSYFVGSGFNVDAGQQRVTLLLPWVKPLRSMRSASTSRAPLSGLFARLRLIRSCVFPRELQIAQAQDLCKERCGMFSQKKPSLTGV